MYDVLRRVFCFSSGKSQWLSLRAQCLIPDVIHDVLGTSSEPLSAGSRNQLPTLRNNGLTKSKTRSLHNSMPFQKDFWGGLFVPSASFEFLFAIVQAKEGGKLGDSRSPLSLEPFASNCWLVLTVPYDDAPQNAEHKGTSLASSFSYPAALTLSCQLPDACLRLPQDLGIYPNISAEQATEVLARQAIQKAKESPFIWGYIDSPQGPFYVCCLNTT